MDLKENINNLKRNIEYINDYNINDYLNKLQDIVTDIIEIKAFEGSSIYSHELDSICEKIAFRKKTDFLDFENTESSQSIILASELTKAGGHGSFIKDIIKYSKWGNNRIIITNPFSRIENNSIDDYKLHFLSEIELLQGENKNEKIDNLVSLLYKYQPERIILVVHHQDVISIVASLLYKKAERFFIHHCDYQIALGVTIQEFTHVDLHNLGYHRCQNELDIKKQKYWPLTGTENIFNCNREFLINKSITSCTSGHQWKFKDSTYEYQYTKVLPEILNETKGTHYHIGYISNEYLQEIYTSLDNALIPRECFIHIPWVDSLAKSLTEYNIDVYISSFPLGGGKASIEAMSAGIPLIMHGNYRTSLFSGIDLVYPSAWIWKNEEEIKNILKGITHNCLKKHSLDSYKHYKKYYSNELFSIALQNIGVKSIQIPPLRRYIKNPLFSNIESMNYYKKLFEKTDTNKLKNALIKESIKESNEKKSTAYKIYVLQREFIRSLLKPFKRALKLLKDFYNTDIYYIYKSGLFRDDFFSKRKNITYLIKRYLNNWKNGEDLKKPMPGFHPGIYASKISLKGCDPFVHYIRNGAPSGEWSFPLITPNTNISKINNKIRTAIHIHAYYPEMANEILDRIIRSKTQPDLLISVVSRKNSEIIESLLKDKYSGNYQIRVTPNRGRDLGPFLTEFKREIKKYELIGHFHTKVSPHLSNRNEAANWYQFLLENMLGGIAPMMDITLAVMAQNSKIGLVFADDPHVFGWMKNFENAKYLAEKMGIYKSLEEHFNFPAGSMFWARTDALKPLFDLNLVWNDYPIEPINDDGTMLHAIERLIPFVVKHTGFDIAVSNVPGVSY